MNNFSDRLYVKISNTFFVPNFTIDTNDGPLLDDTGETIFSSIEQYIEEENLFGTSGILYDSDGNEIFSI